MESVPEPQPRPSTAEDVRRALVWYFVDGDIVVKCRHVAFIDLTYSGQIPLPILDAFTTAAAAREAAPPAEITDRQQHTLLVARTFASLAAIEPRISLESTGDPAVLMASELPDSFVIKLMNEGLSRRLAFDVRRAGIFRAGGEAAAAPAGPAGPAVPDAAEPLAAADGRDR
jgi:hypothetical protein